MLHCKKIGVLLMFRQAFFICVFLAAPRLAFSAQNSVAALTISISSPLLNVGQNKLCRELSKRFTHGTFEMGMGPFASVTCANHAIHDPKNWQLDIAEVNGEIHFVINFLKKKRASIYLVSDPVNPHFLQSKDILDLIVYGLLDQLPFLGFIDQNNISGEMLVLQEKHNSIIEEQLPRNLVFYDLEAFESSELITAKVHDSSAVESADGLVAIQRPTLLKKIRNTNFIWFHSALGPGKKNPIIQQKLLTLQKIKLQENKREIVSHRKYFSLKLGKQLNIQDSVIKKSILVGFKAEFNVGFILGLQFSYESSPFVSYDVNAGTETFKWQKIRLGKSVVKRFGSFAFDFTPRFQHLNYRTQLTTVVDNTEIGITEFDVVNSFGSVVEIGIEQISKNKWLRLFYGYDFPFTQKTSTKVRAIHLGFDYFIPIFFKDDFSGSPLLQIFGEYERNVFQKPSQLTDNEISVLELDTFYLGAGVGYHW